MTYPSPPIYAGRKRVFDSVFPPDSFKAIPPTPSATPNLPSTSFGQSFGGHNTPLSPSRDTQSHSFDTSLEQITWDRAWHTATTYLSLPKEPVPEGLPGTNEKLRGRRWFEKPTRDGVEGVYYRLAGERAGGTDVEESERESATTRRWIKSPGREEKQSLYYLLSTSSRGRILRRDSPSQGLDLVTWFTNEVQGHFMNYTGPVVLQELKAQEMDMGLARVLQRLRDALRLYKKRFLDDVCGRLESKERRRAMKRFNHTIFSTVCHSISTPKISELIEPVMRRYVEVILELRESLADNEGVMVDSQDEDHDMDGRFSSSYEVWKQRPVEEDKDTPAMHCARESLKRFIEEIHEVGIGGNIGHIAFANVMNDMIARFVKSAYSGQWDSPSLAVRHLNLWIQGPYARLIQEVFGWFDDANVRHPDSESSVSINSVQRWQAAGLNRLGNLRISELFDVIVEWDASAGAIEDLKHFINTPSNRAHVSSCFAGVISQRLLQPGASTLQILQVYISIIRAFKLLDAKGVLLDRVARPVRKYLRDRDDTVKVIVSGLLADVDDLGADQPQTSTDTLVELSLELTKATKTTTHEDDGDLDYDDMGWVPDPIDAAPDYKKSKNSDVIGSLISLFDSKEVFVKEFQTVMGDRLLKKTTDFEKEIRVLELLKIRFGDSALQACEVMLKDVLDSRRVDTVIRTEQHLDAGADGDTSISDDLATKMHLTHMPPPQLHAKILSRLFWPTLQDQAFKIPAEISALQARYETGFESLKQSRKLTWLNSLGSVAIELDLEDRVFKDEVLPYQAAVIHAFQSADSESSSGSSSNPPIITKTVDDLATELEMDPTLILATCIFWLSKRILTQTSTHPPTFRVLETLPSSSPSSPNHPSTHHDHDHSSTAQSTTSTTIASASAAAEEAAAAAEAKAAADAASVKMAMYWQFVKGMLTNQGPMPLGRITMMLKMVVPGGFPYEGEELRGFLATKIGVRDGEAVLEMGANGVYRIVK
jgi:anaphase-promoting complex subunit 2